MKQNAAEFYLIVTYIKIKSKTLNKITNVSLNVKVSGNLKDELQQAARVSSE